MEMENKEPSAASEVCLREGALGEFARIVEQLATRRVFFVVDESAFSASGADEILRPVLESLDVMRFADFELNPKLADVERGLQLYRGFQPDLVVALGGGTAIDLGKLISSLAEQEGEPRDIIIGKAPIRQPGRRLVAIPTTSGTGSEATHFAVAYVAGEKYSLADPSLLPDFAIIDPLLTHSLPAGITAATGLDAFCQAIESIWAVGATEESIAFAAAAARLALDHLQSAVGSPTPSARFGMCRASHLAGKAINISKTTASHALSYELTSRHGIPHGIAVALTLSPMLAYNAQVTGVDCTDPRGAEHVLERIALILEILEAESVAAACRRIEALIAAIDCPVTLAQAGIRGEHEVRQLVSRVDSHRMANNPRETSVESLWRLLENTAAVSSPKFTKTQV